MNHSFISEIYVQDIWLKLSRRFRPSFLLPYDPMRMWEKEWKSPKTFKSHKTTPITTTAFKIDLICDCIGMKLLTSQSRTPTTIRIVNN
jgi:hypothetical protein